MPSPKLEPLVLSAEERQVLEGWARRRKTSQALALRSRIVLACAVGQSITDVAADLGVSRDTVRKWRGRFAVSRLEGLSDDRRPGAPRKITDEQVELVITKTLEERGPGEDTHWSTRSMAAATRDEPVGGLADLAGVRPQAHLVETWKLSADPQFIEKVRDVVGLYLDPPEKALVLAVEVTIVASISTVTRPPSAPGAASPARSQARSRAVARAARMAFSARGASAARAGDQPGDHRVGGHRPGQFWLSPQYRYVSQAVAAQRHRDRQIGDDLPWVVHGPGRPLSFQRRVQAGCPERPGEQQAVGLADDSGAVSGLP